MIRAFRHRGLERLCTRSDHRGIPVRGAGRRGTYAVSVSGNWRVTFRFEGEDAVDVSPEDYH